MEIKTRIVKSGHAFAFRVPKALIDCKVLDKEKEYILKVVENLYKFRFSVAQNVYSGVVA